MNDTAQPARLRVLVAEQVTLVARDLAEEVRVAMPECDIAIWTGDGEPEMARPDLLFWGLGLDRPEWYQTFERLAPVASRTVLLNMQRPGDKPLPLHYLPMPAHPEAIHRHVQAMLENESDTDPDWGAEPA